MKKKLKKILVVLGAIIVLVFIVCRFGWHLNRNQYNQLPKGMLTVISERQYQDSTGLIWELQPHSKNIFHQPDLPVPKVEHPYPIVSGGLLYDAEYPNLKFLCLNDDGSSFEAILQPDGSYLTTGKLKGTYNYSHPEGFWGNTMHIILDVIPHLVSSKYQQDPPQQ